MVKKAFWVKVLTLTMAASMTVSPVTAFAEGMQEVDASDEDKKADLGDVKADGEKEDAVEIWADGHKAEVTTGDIESADGNGLYTYATSDAEINVNVNGDINTPAEISTGSQRSASGVTTNSQLGSKQDIQVNGDIVSGDVGIAAKTYDLYDGDDPDIYGEEDYGDSTTQIRVNGDITAGATGIELTAGSGGENYIEVIGDVTGFANGSDSQEHDDGAIWVTANKTNSRNDVVVQGDVTGDCIGVWMEVPAENEDEKVQNNVVIDGTLSAKVAGILSEEALCEGANTITVWKIETPGYTAAKWLYDEQDEEDPFYLVEDEDTEKRIQYIIRVNQADKATLTATDENGKPLATVKGAGGSVLEYAHEGDKVLLKVDVADGYWIEGAYGDEGQHLELLRDENGNYYLKVPRNGGVSFSVRLIQVGHQRAENGTSTSQSEPASVNLSNVTGLSQGTRILRTMQGDAAKVAFLDGKPAGYTESFSFNLITGQKAEMTLKNGSFTMDIPKELQKAGRTFALIGLDKNGMAWVFSDTDKNPETITVTINLEGYAFELIYKD